MKYYSNPLNRFHTQMKITATTGSEIINTATAKSYLRVDTSADDTLIENYITKDIAAKTRKLYLASVDERFVLPFSPIASIQSITVEGTATTAYTEYGLDDTIVELNSLPSKEVIVSYTTAGMNDSFLIQANLQLVSTLYDNRADFVIGNTVNEIPTSVKELLSSYKTMFI